MCWCIRKKQGQLSRMFPPTRSQRQLPTHWQCHRWFIILLALCQICHSVSLRLCLVLHLSEFSTMDFHSFFIRSKTENISILYLCTVKTPGLRVVRRLFYEIYIFFVVAWCSGRVQSPHSCGLISNSRLNLEVIQTIHVLKDKRPVKNSFYDEIIVSSVRLVRSSTLI